MYLKFGKYCDLFVVTHVSFVQIHETFGISVFDFYCRNAFLKLKKLAVKCSGRDTVNLFFYLLQNKMQDLALKQCS